MPYLIVDESAVREKDPGANNRSDTATKRTPRGTQSQVFRVICAPSADSRAAIASDTFSFF